MIYAVVITASVLAMSMIGHRTMVNGKRLFEAMHRRVTGDDFADPNGTMRSPLFGLFLAAVAPVCGVYACATFATPRRAAGFLALGLAMGTTRTSEVHPLHGAEILTAINEWADLGMKVMVRLRLPDPAPSDDEDDQHDWYDNNDEE